MTLNDLGYTSDLDTYRIANDLGSFGVGRVIAEHRERYIIKTASQEYEGEVIGNLRYSADSRSSFPAVGDWVAISEYDDDKVLIHHVFPRFSMVSRRAIGVQAEKQIIATNIDYGLIVQAVDRDFNLNRLERYLTVCHNSGVIPIVVLNKIDLIDDAVLAALLVQVKERVAEVPTVAISNQNLAGMDELRALIYKGKTYCLLGSSGVGKSSLVNNLVGHDLMQTNSISSSTNKGRHVTSHRELAVLRDGGIIIDNPGMREVGIADSSEGLQITFAKITELSSQCKFKDCQHLDEIDCAVLEAIELGDLDLNLYENYQKMQREKDHYESTVAEKRKRDKKFGKMVKQFKRIKGEK